MKKIINGKLYDTATAEFIGSYDNGGTPSDFDYVEETLYRKKNGEFFIHGMGGARSKYSVVSSDGWHSGGEKITPKDEAAAKKWSEEHISADKYIEVFGAVEE